MTVDRFRLLLRIVLAYFVGIFLAGVVALPFFGVLGFALAIGAWFYASPLLGAALLAGLLFAPSIVRRPRVWASCAGLIALMTYVFFDPPSSVFAMQRDGLAAVCALSAVLVFIFFDGWFLDRR